MPRRWHFEPVHDEPQLAAPEEEAVPVPRSAASLVCTDDGTLVLFGGEAGMEVSRAERGMGDVWMLGAPLGGWAECSCPAARWEAWQCGTVALEDVPTPRSNHAAVACGEQLGCRPPTAHRWRRDAGSWAVRPRRAVHCPGRSVSAAGGRGCASRACNLPSAAALPYAADGIRLARRAQSIQNARAVRHRHPAMPRVRRGRDRVQGAAAAAVLLASPAAAQQTMRPGGRIEYG